jgi:hypothetical protein
LLNNLSVYCGCDIVFDSMDVPERALDSAPPSDPTTLVSLGGLQAQLEALQLASGDSRISPTLDAILELLDEAPAADAAAEAEEFVVAVAAAADAAPPVSWARPAVVAPGADGNAQAADGGEDGEAGQGEQPEASMEGVAAEYAHVAAPGPADAGDGALALGWLMPCCHDAACRTSVRPACRCLGTATRLSLPGCMALLVEQQLAPHAARMRRLLRRRRGLWRRRRRLLFGGRGRRAALWGPRQRRCGARRR